MPRQVAYAEGFEAAIDELTEGENRKQVRKKLLVIIDFPKSIGRRTASPSGCRHVDVCHGQLVIVWRYEADSDTVHFLKFGKHSKIFR